jgi:hypothetical protein
MLGMIDATVFFGNNNKYKISLYPTLKLGRLVEVLSKPLGLVPEDILYIIGNGQMVGYTDRMSFERTVSSLPVVDGQCHFHLVFTPKEYGPEFDRLIQARNLAWLRACPPPPAARTQPRTPLPATAPGNSLINSLMNLYTEYEQMVELEGVAVTIPVGELNNYITEAVDTGDDEPECFCGTQLNRSDMVMFIDKCGHRFHYDCIKRWLTEQSVLCPICQEDVR